MDATSFASGLLALNTFALQSTIRLHERVKSFQYNQKRVHKLLDELCALSTVLGSLSDAVQANHDADFSGLKIPLQRCGNVCADFEREISKHFSHADNNRTSFRGWVKFRYMGEDIDGLRRLLASYKATISVALVDAILYINTRSRLTLLHC